MTGTNQRGVAILWTAFFLLMMLGFVAIGIDVAKVMATRTQLQNAADAAAMAGVSAIDHGTGALVADSATVRAQQTAFRNQAFVDGPQPITLPAADVTTDVGAKTVTVTVRRSAATDGPMVTHVAQVLGINTVNLSATATAKADWVKEICDGLTPMGAVSSAGGFLPGCAHEYTLKSGTGTQGNYQAMDFPACDEGPCAGSQTTGASTFSCLLANGYGCCISVNQVLNTETGKMTGQTNKGLQDRWDSDTDQNSDICYEAYHGNGRRVVTVPILTIDPKDKNHATVQKFGVFFLKRRPQGGGHDEVVAEFVYDIVPGVGGGPAGTVLALRLTK